MKSWSVIGVFALFGLGAASCDGSGGNGDETHFVGSGTSHRHMPACAPGGCDAGAEPDGAGAVSSTKGGDPGSSDTTIGTMRDARADFGSGGSPGVGSFGGAAASTCSPLEKLCDGMCILRTPLTGCANESCAPCADPPPLNGILLCNIQGNCDFDCVSGYQRNGSDCVARIDSGTGGAPGTNGTGGAANVHTTLPSCSDAAKNGNESDTDCGGGACPPCAPGRNCHGSFDCTSSVCVQMVCREPTCNDLVRNGDETSTDCGGSCPPCAFVGLCKGPNDCGSKVCKDGQCLAPTCNDGVTNQDETAEDCGGSNCPKCGPGKACGVDGDCMSGVCDAKVCQ